VLRRGLAGLEFLPISSVSLAAGSPGDNPEDRNLLIFRVFSKNPLQHLQSTTIRLILYSMNTVTKPDVRVHLDPEPTPAVAPPTVIVAPELHGRRDGVVIREPDDTDAEYQARCELVALLLDHAEKA
jgi:hypothetical protein